jgi:hypothetical protein
MATADEIKKVNIEKMGDRSEPNILSCGRNWQASTSSGESLSMLNVVEVHYKKGETRFDMAARHGGALNLLYVL